MNPPEQVIGHTENSTTGRNEKSVKTGQRLLKPVLHGAQRLSPRLTAHLLQPWLLRPGKPRRHLDHAAQLATAERLDFTLQGKPVALYGFGSGPLVLLAHGWSGNATQMMALVSPLLAQGFRVLALDMPGHGASAGRQSSVLHFCRAIEHCSAKYGPLHGIVAHSLACLAVTLALSRGLAVRQLVYIGALTRFAPVWQHFANTLALRQDTQAYLQQGMENTIGLKFDMLDSTRLAAALGVWPPLLLWHDQDDREVPWQESAQLTQCWPGAQLQTSRGLGHVRILQHADMATRIADTMIKPGKAIAGHIAPFPASCY